MASALDMLKTAFESLKSGPTTPFLSEENVYTYDMKGIPSSKKAGKDYIQDSVFAFIPVYDKDSNVDIYIRLGGNEAIQKLSSEMEVYNTGGTSQRFVDIRDYYTDVSNFAYTYGTVVNDDDDMNFSPKFAPERILLQRTVLGKFEWDQFMPLVRRLYPIRLHKDGNTFKLQYAALNNDYKELSDPSVLASFELELISSLIYIVFERTGDEQKAANMLTLLQGLKTETVQSGLMTYVKDTFIREFTRAIENHVCTYDDDNLAADNDYDTVFLAAFAQFTNPFKTDMVNILAQANRIILELSNDILTQDQIKGASATVTKYVKQLGSDATGANQDNIAAVQALTKQNTELSQKLEADKTKAADEASSLRKKERIVGAASAAAVTIWALQDEDLKDLDYMQKGILIATGGALGALMPTGFTPLAVLAAPVTASFLGKQLVKHEITAENTKRRYGELSEQAKIKYGELSEQAKTKYGELSEQAKTKYGELSDRAKTKIDSYRRGSDESESRANPKRRRRKKM